MLRRRAVHLATVVALLAVPATAFGHAALLHTDPVASKVVDGSPAQVSLTYSEPVEPRFAIVSVTDASGTQETNGAPRRPPGSNTLVVPVKKLAAGWYLVFWRVISVDGHPVRGAFEFAVGPNPGPSPQFVIPSTSETAATTQLVVTRAIVYAALLAAIGLLAFRLVIARPAARMADASLRGVTIAAIVALAIAAIATPVYLLLATAQFALRSATAISDLVPLIRASSFGRGFTDLWIVVGLLALAGLLAIAIDRPERPHRSIAEIGALAGVALAAAAALVIPGLAGHPVATSPVGVAEGADWTHLAAGSLWLGGLIGLVLLAVTTPGARRVAVLSVVAPRFSKVALTAVIAIVASGSIAAYLHLPTLSSLWETSYGKALLAKIILLCVAIPLGALNMLRARPRLETETAEPDVRQSGARLLVRQVGGEIGIISVIVVVAAILTSLPPPPKALANLGSVAATFGPGTVNARVVQSGPYRVAVSVAPNRAAVPNSYQVAVTRGGKPVTGAAVKLRFTMLDMDMGQQVYELQESPAGSGVYTHDAPAFVMVGRWGVDVNVTPAGGQPFDVLVLDHPGG
jgi:copper transport protein